MTDRETLIRSLGTITLEAGWIDVCGDLGDLLDGLIKAGWRAPEPPCRHLSWMAFDGGILAEDTPCFCTKCGLVAEGIKR